MFTGLTWAPLVEKKSPQDTHVTQSRSKTEPGAVAPMATAEKPRRDGDLAPPATQGMWMCGKPTWNPDSSIGSLTYKEKSKGGAKASV